MTHAKTIAAAVRSRRAMLVAMELRDGADAGTARRRADFVLRSYLRDRVKVRNKHQKPLRRYCEQHIEGF